MNRPNFSEMEVQGGIDAAFIDPKNTVGQENSNPDSDSQKIEQEKKELLLKEQIDVVVGKLNFNKDNHLALCDDLVKDFGVENNEKVIAYIYAVGGIRAQIGREKGRMGGKETYIPEEIKYKRNIGKFINEWREEPKVIHGLWEKIKKEYASFQEAYPDAYEQTFEGFKFGTLAELAAIDAVNESMAKLNKQKFGIKEYKVETASIKADGKKATDFFILLTYLNGKVERLACSVTSFNIKIGYSSVMEEKIKYCGERMVSLINSNKSKDRTGRSYRTGVAGYAHEKNQGLRDKGFSWSGSHDGLSFFLPADKDLLMEDGSLSNECGEVFQKKFLEQFEKNFSSIG